MKKYIISILLILFCISFLFSHPASNINFKYQKENKILTVEIAHFVEDRTEHYIKNITVYLNKKKIINQDAESQINKKKQVFLYKIIDLKDGDKIKVEVKCIKHGRKIANYKVTF